MSNDNTQTDDNQRDREIENNAGPAAFVDTTNPSGQAGAAGVKDREVTSGSGSGSGDGPSDGPSPGMMGGPPGSGDDEDKPDPSEVDSIDTSKHVYQRDAEGELLPEQSVVKIDDEWSKVEHLPPTRGFLNRIQEQFGGRDDIDMEEMDDLMADFYTDPDLTIEEWEDCAADFYLTLMWAMIEAVMGDTDDAVMEDLQGAVQRRQQAEGN